MKLIIAVAEDLFTFAAEALFGRRAAPAFPGEAEDNSVISLGGVTQSRALTQSRAQQLVAYTQHAAPSSETVQYVPKNTVMYTASIDVPLYVEPRKDPEMVFGTLPYGAMVMVLDSQKEWAHVVSGDKEGWVSVQDLADRAAYVYPQFTSDEPNGVDDPNTIRLRAVINDAFGHGAAGMPLQGEEYVLYKLQRRNVEIHWPNAQPQQPGSWCVVLAKEPGVTISGTPKVGGVMEYVPNGEMVHGHLAYIEAVFPDGSITVSEVNGFDGGIYGERMLEKEDQESEDIVFLYIA